MARELDFEFQKLHRMGAVLPIRIAETKLAGVKRLVSPLEIFGSNRKSAQGYDIGIKKDYDDIVSNLNKYSNQYHKISSLIKGNPTVKTPKDFKILKPSSLEKIGVFDKASIDEIKKALALSHQAFHSWSSVPVEKRAKVIEKFGNLLHENRYFFYSLLIREAGKNIKDSTAEVREEIDFARYYAQRARELLSKPLQMPGLYRRNQ
ncbi:MAG: aldehyde dehydrogenase family protein [Candidatus Midichloria mitochondrii]|nr:aldehyde dehydrogenase family protein [Candidatus Midichloria mitochondrii]